MNGIINVLKPPGMTSNDVIVSIRRMLGEKKAGHAGTLDPGAAGVLPVCTGRATRLFDYLVDKEKEYIAEITFGVETDSQDQYGAITVKRDGIPDHGALCEAVAAQTGSILQKPPMYSAIKHQGRKLYDLAREGADIEVKERRVDIHAIDILKQNAPKSWLLKIRCSRGTYIRTICHDIGQRLKCGAHLSMLIRTACGPFAIQHSYTLEQIKETYETKAIQDILLPMDFSLQDYSRIDLGAEEFRALRNGRSIHTDAGDEFNRLYYNADLIGIGQTLAGECRIKTFLMQV